MMLAAYLLALSLAYAVGAATNPDGACDAAPVFAILLLVPGVVGRVVHHARRGHHRTAGRRA